MLDKARRKENTGFNIAMTKLYSNNCRCNVTLYHCKIWGDKKCPQCVGDEAASANLKATPVVAIPMQDQDQVKRDLEENEVMDSIPLDVSAFSADEFYSADEFSNATSDLLSLEAELDSVEEPADSDVECTGNNSNAI